MNKRTVLCGWAVVVTGWAGLALAVPRETLEAIEREIAEKWTKIKTLSGTMTMSSDMSMEGSSSKSESTGTYEYMKKGDKLVYRMHMKMSMVNNFGGQEMKMDSEVTSICDGAFVYTLTDQGGQKSAAKMKADNSQSMDTMSTLTTLRQHNTLKLLADESLDGQGVYTIEAMAKEPASPMPRTVMYIAKDNGVLLKSVSFDKAGKQAATMLFKDIKVNGEISADRFTFKAPEGVEVLDMSAQAP